MSTAWVPPRRSYYLRIFAVSLFLIVASLSAFLFGVHLEAVAPAVGVITARDLTDLRAPFAGLVEPGWYEGEITLDDGAPLSVRLDPQGYGMTDPRHGPAQTVYQYEIGGSQRRRVAVEKVRFHRLMPGAALWPGQVVAALRPIEPRARLDPLDPRLPRPDGDPPSMIDLFRPDRLRLMPPATDLRVPETGSCWLAVQVPVAPHQAVQPGDVVATVVPIDPDTQQPVGLQARLDIDERYWSEIAAGQTVRLESALHNPRLHGRAEGCIERLEPWGEPGPNGHRRFHAVAAITHTPFALWLGSSCKAEVVVGRKRVYRIILEN
jgi:hypothetical protein